MSKTMSDAKMEKLRKLLAEYDAKQKASGVDPLKRQEYNKKTGLPKNAKAKGGKVKPKKMMGGKVAKKRMYGGSVKKSK